MYITSSASMGPVNSAASINIINAIPMSERQTHDHRFNDRFIMVMSADASICLHMHLAMAFRQSIAIEADLQLHQTILHLCSQCWFKPVVAWHY